MDNPGPEQAKFKWSGQSMCTVRALHTCIYICYSIYMWKELQIQCNYKQWPTHYWAYALSLLWTQLQYLVYLVDFVVNSMPCLQLQVVTLHVLCVCAEPRPSLDLILAWVKKWSSQNQAAQTASASPVTCCFGASAAWNRVTPLILLASNTTTRFRSKTSNFCNFTPEYTRNDLRSFSGEGGGGQAPRPT